MTQARLLLLALGVFCLLAGGGRACAADAAAAKALAQGCGACHGEDGVSPTPLVPSLAGEPDDFIQWQLVFFRGGGRKSEIMGPIAEALSNEDIRNLGAYYAALPPPKPEPAAAPDVLAESGAKLALRLRCTSCHGDDDAGVGPAARLAAQREDVLLKALHDFKTGARVGVGVGAMADVVYGLSDDDMRALAHFMATQP